MTYTTYRPVSKSTVVAYDVYIPWQIQNCIHTTLLHLMPRDPSTILVGGPSLASDCSQSVDPVARDRRGNGVGGGVRGWRTDVGMAGRK